MFLFASHPRHCRLAIALGRVGRQRVYGERRELCTQCRACFHKRLQILYIAAGVGVLYYGRGSDFAKRRVVSGFEMVRCMVDKYLKLANLEIQSSPRCHASS